MFFFLFFGLTTLNLQQIFVLKGSSKNALSLLQPRSSLREHFGNQILRSTLCEINRTTYPEEGTKVIIIIFFSKMKLDEYIVNLIKFMFVLIRYDLSSWGTFFVPNTQSIDGST